MGDDSAEVRLLSAWERLATRTAPAHALRFDVDGQPERVHRPERESELGAWFSLFELGDPESACADTLTELGLTEPGGHAGLPGQRPDGGGIEGLAHGEMLTIVNITRVLTIVNMWMRRLVSSGPAVGVEPAGLGADETAGSHLYAAYDAGDTHDARGPIDLA